jgi:hypothetical protein
MADEVLQAQDAAAAAVAVAPRVTLEYLEKEIIRAANYFTAGAAIRALGQPVHERHDVLTICVLVLRNGFVVTGTSSSANSENFDEGLGQRIAYRNALDEVWKLEGYLLRQSLHEND